MNEMMRIKGNFLILSICFVIIISCDFNGTEPAPPNEPEDPELPVTPEILFLPVVVHILHNGETVGEGTNISVGRIKRQIEILNEDFRRKEGTRGFNSHPDGADTKIEFVLAQQDPNGNATDGIVRTKFSFTDIPDEVPNTEVDRMGYFSYWNPEHYINIWSAPYGEELANLHLGSATGPDSDLPGDDLFVKPLPNGKEGIVINWWHFGESDIKGVNNLGRTLTHEMGHYLGLLHTWGGGDCDANDYCSDTPAVDKVVDSSNPYNGCDGEEVQLANYMNYTPDSIMNMFTNDQAARMHYVLENSARRTSLLSSPGLEEPL